MMRPVSTLDIAPEAVDQWRALVESRGRKTQGRCNCGCRCSTTVGAVVRAGPDGP